MSCNSKQKDQIKIQMNVFFVKKIKKFVKKIKQWIYIVKKEKIKQLIYCRKGKMNVL
jgi:hypothetical protein